MGRRATNFKTRKEWVAAAEWRVNRCLSNMRGIASLGIADYPFSEADAKRIIGALRRQIDILEVHLVPGGKRFMLLDEGGDGDA